MKIMTDEIRLIWEDLVKVSLKNLASNSPSWGDEAIIQADLELKRRELENANISFKMDLVETRLLRITSGSVIHEYKDLYAEW